LLSWLIPGSGHWYLGLRGHFWVYFVSIEATFWLGMLVGGIRSTVDPQANPAWFFAQICAGLNAVAALILSNVPSAAPCYGKTLDVAVIYTGVAGLLNVLVVFDAMVRANFAAVPAQQRSRRQRR